MARPPRIPGYSYTGVQRYFITICTKDRAGYFENDEAVALVMAEFLRISKEEEVAILVYCVMPDHLHLLVEGSSDRAELLTFVSRAKQFAAWEFRKRFNKPLWQKGYYEHVLRDAEKTEDVIEYIVRNPLRRNLVEVPEDYPHWGSMMYSREEILRFIGDTSKCKP